VQVHLGWKGSTVFSVITASRNCSVCCLPLTCASEYVTSAASLLPSDSASRGGRTRRLLFLLYPGYRMVPVCLLPLLPPLALLLGAGLLFSPSLLLLPAGGATRSPDC
jgi:hypothetical protein